MTVTARGPTDNNLGALWHSACKDYATETGITLEDEKFPKIQGPEDLSRQLDSETVHFEDFRMKRRPLFHAMQMVLAPFESWGGLIADVATAAFPPASSIMGAMLLLIRAARRVSAAFDVLVDLFRKLGNFSLRLDSYKGVPLSAGMKTIIVKVLVNFLRVCGASQKLLSHGSLKARLSKWAKNILVEDTSISSLLGELEELTSQEHMMVSAHGLNLTHQALRNTEVLLDRDDRKNERERLEMVKAALNPISASGQVSSSISHNRIPGSGRWVEDRFRHWWQGPQPLLWLHGGPGVGKSHLASKIISDLSNKHSSVLPPRAVASFFHKNNDVDLRSVNKSLRTLAWQVATQQSSFAVHAEEFCLKEDPGDSYVVWEKLFLNYFRDAPRDTATCLVIDGIDESETEEQEILFSLLEKAFSEEDDMKRFPSLRVVLFSRDSVRGMLDEHSLSWIPEIEVGNDQNKDDLQQYVSQKLQKTKLLRGYPELQEEIVNDITQEAEGMWEWANLVVKSVLRCRTKEHIRKVIKTMPRGISAMLRQELQRLSMELSGLEDMSDDVASDGEGTATRVEQLNILLSFVTLAQQPLTVCQLVIILEISLKEEFLSLEDDIRTIYSSLFSTRANDNDDHNGEEDGGEIVTLRHSSFYEYFRTTKESGLIHVDIDRGEVNFLYVLLYALKEQSRPCSRGSISALWGYTGKFLPLHLSRANPKTSGSLRGGISILFASLFSEEQDRNWLLNEFHVKEFSSYSFYPTCRVGELGSYWLDAPDPDTANKRAEAVLNWFLPDAKQMFVNQSQSSAVASEACPFTVLFSYLVASWSRFWLDPEEKMVDDGLPAVVPAILTVYNAMATDTGASRKVQVSDIIMHSHRKPARVLVPAETQKLQRTPMWHVRVAQALLLHRCYAQALDYFQISLDENQRTPTFSTQSLSVIHENLARAYTELARHKEALQHLQLSESLHNPAQARSRFSGESLVDELLNKAQMRHLAKLTDDAIATAEEAWKLFMEEKDVVVRDMGLFPFFKIFLELNQPHRLRSVFDLAFTHFEETAESRTRPLEFEHFVRNSLIFGSRVMYRVIHYALAHDDRHHLDTIAEVMKSFDTEDNNSMEVRYLLATVLFEKGQRDAGVQGWYKLASIPIHPGDPGDSPTLWDLSSRMRSIGHLAALCLVDADMPSFERQPLILKDIYGLGDICIILSSWFRDRGDLTNARDALRWSVKDCISLLSDDDPSNDIDAFVRLFRTFLVTSDSDEDLQAALYLAKRDTEPRMRVVRNLRGIRQSDDPEQIGAPTAPSTAQVPEGEDQNLDDDNIDMYDSDFSGVASDLLTECSSCKREVGPLHQWYFCRSCPFSTLCGRCYRQLESDNPTNLSGICDPNHIFYYTGPLLQPSESAPEGMLPLVTSDGKRHVIWVEEWKDRLEEKWETAELAIEGGLSAWCMRVLPEPQRARWATFFQA